MRRKKRILSLTLIVIAIILVLGVVGYMIVSNNQNSNQNGSDEKIETSNNDNKLEELVQQETKEEPIPAPEKEDSTKELFEDFLSGKIDAVVVDEIEESEYTINVTDLDIDGDNWDSNKVYGYLDVDNDGEDELVITGPYGVSLFDAKDGKVKRFVAPFGAGSTLLLAKYENEYWVVNAHAEADSDRYSMNKYNGADTVAETMYFGSETDENGNETYYKGNGSGEDLSITEEEYRKYVDSIIPCN